jgi:predicted NAD/FAD-dependent oxidoreductase
MVGYGSADIPDWAMMDCENDVIESITNEASKRDGNPECSFVIHTKADFSEKYKDSNREEVEEIILDEVAEILGGWSALPEWKQLHFWRYSKVVNPIPYPFLEVVGHDAPIALIGSYMNGDSIESAYLSGLAIGEFWSDKFRTKKS